MRIKIPAQMWKSPTKFVSDGKYSPEGTISYRHLISIQGEAAKLYADEDLTSGLNGSRAKLDTGDPVDVNAEVDLYVTSGGKLGVALVALTERKG